MVFLFKLIYWKFMVYLVLTSRYEALAAKLQRNSSTQSDHTNAITTQVVLDTLEEKIQKVLNYSTTTVVHSSTENEATFGFCQVGFTYEKFNYKTQYCCHGKPRCIKSKTSRQQLCCNDTLPNGTTVTCCNTRHISIVLLKHAACCDIDFINFDLEFCYNNSPYSKHNLTQTYRKSAETLQTEEQPRNRFKLEAYILFFTCVIVLVLVSLITLLRIIVSESRIKTTYIKNPSRKRKGVMEKHNQKIKETSFQSTKTENAFVEEVEADGYESIADNENLLVQKEGSYNFAYGDEKYKCNLSRDSHTSNKSSQTEEDKTRNVSNIMGKEFDVRHVFDKNNRSLVLPHSSVKLTLSEEDVSTGSTECYASTFRNLNEIYNTFKKYLKDGSEIVSPTVEFFFPQTQSLKSFATVEMDYNYCVCVMNSLTVWRFESDVERGVVIKQEEITNIKTQNAENADMCYEIVSTRKIKIYLKHFCTLMCSVCHENHECLTLTGHPYTETLPGNGAIEHVKVTLYILARVSQLQDYAHLLEQIVGASGQRSVLPKKINLPRRVQLEDYLGIHFHLWTDSIGIWKERKIGTQLDDCENVQLHNIVDCPKHNPNGSPFSMEWHCPKHNPNGSPFSMEWHCPKHNPNGSPFSMEWHFECNLDDIVQHCSEVILKGAFSIAMINPHPGVNTTDPPSTKFVVCHEVDITDVKKHFLGQGAGRGINVPTVDSTNTSDVRAETADDSFS